MLKFISSDRHWQMQKHEAEWQELVGRLQKARGWFKGIPAIEDLLWYIENGKTEETRSVRDKFITSAEKLGWEFPKHLK